MRYEYTNPHHVNKGRWPADMDLEGACLLSMNALRIHGVKCVPLACRHCISGAGQGARIGEASQCVFFFGPANQFRINLIEGEI